MTPVEMVGKYAVECAMMAYNSWLGFQVHTWEPAYENYNLLLGYLASTDFDYAPFDEDRCLDGLQLRKTFEAEECNNFIGLSASRCSVLEMLVALAIRIDSTVTGEPGVDNAYHWFWTFINNLGLRGQTDDSFEPSYVEDVLYTFMTRNYAPDGHGGLFFVKMNNNVDMRTLPIWKQMWECLYDSNGGI